MRDPTTTATAAEKVRVRDAIEKAKVRLYWALVSDRRWTDSRWGGQDPKDEWKTGFNAAIEVARQIINDPACESLLHKHAGVPGARELIAAALSRACPRARKKGELRELMNVLRDQRIAEAVALTCKDDAFSPTRQRDAKATSRRRESGASIVVEALRQLATDHPRARLKKLSEKSVNDIWAEHQQAYRHLLPR
jgi:hypothetical protein